MKTLHSTLLVVAAASLGTLSTGCFEGPNGIPGNHRNNDAPIVVTTAPAGLASIEFDVTFTAYDPDSEFVTLWDACPNPDAPDAAPILNVGYSVDGGSSFQAIDPADLQIDGAAVTVPTCGEVKRFDDSIRIAVSTSGEDHVITWNSIPYVPTSADIVFRVSVSDGSFQSEPGDSDEFVVANLPSFSVVPLGLRPGETFLGADLSGLLTTWGGTTTVGSADNLTVTNLTATSTTAATADITMGSDDEQILRTFSLITPGAGIPSGDEVAEGSLWTCNELGQPVIEFETASLGGIFQYICDQGDFDIEGSITEGDQDVFQLVAASSGDYAISFDWTNGTDYDLVVLNEEGNAVIGAPGPFGCGDCCSENKPETCTAPLVAGTTYLILVQHYAGPAGDYDVTANVP